MRCSSVASPICQEGQIEIENPDFGLFFPIFPLFPICFLICPLFLMFFPSFSRFLANFSLCALALPFTPLLATPLVGCEMYEHSRPLNMSSRKNVIPLLMTDVAPILGFPDLSSAVLNLCFILSRVVLLTTLSMASSERDLPRNSATCTTARLRSCMMGEIEIYTYQNQEAQWLSYGAEGLRIKISTGPKSIMLRTWARHFTLICSTPPRWTKWLPA